MEAKGSNLVTFGERAQAVREMPHNLDAEQTLLGAILLDNDKVHVVADLLRAEHFFQRVHGRIFDAVLKVVSRNEQATAVTIRAYFQSDDALKEVGGAHYLDRLEASVVSVVSARTFAETIVDCWMRRELIRVADNALQIAYDPTVDDQADIIAAGLSQAVDEITGAVPRGGFVSHATMLAESLAVVERAATGRGIEGVRTGLNDVDRMVGALEDGTLTVIAGATSIGKTTLADEIACNVAAGRSQVGGQGFSVAKFSLEMTRRQLGQRELSRHSGIALDRLRRGNIGGPEFVTLQDVANRNGEALDIWVDDTPRQTLRSIMDRSRALQRRVPGLRLVIVDYMQLIAPDDRYKGRRVDEVSQISHGLQELARVLNVPVVALSQLKRLGDREDKTPQKSDLRESGDIENDADLIMLVHRVHYWQPEPPEDDPQGAIEWEKERDTMQVIIAKQRQGPLGVARERYDATTGRFGETYDRIPAQTTFELTAGDHPNAPGTA